MPGPLGTRTNSPSIDRGTLARVEHRPPSRVAPTAPHASAREVADGVSHVVVRPGDSFWSIAADRLGDPTRHADLARLNGLTDRSVLRAGQKLIVPDYRRSDMTAAFMLTEMIRNAQSRDAEAVAAANARSSKSQADGDQAMADMKQARWYEIFRTMGDQQILESAMQLSGTAKVEAMARWFLLVRVDGPWDHKPILRRMYGAMPSPPRPFGTLGKAYHFPIRGDVAHEYYYDVWSNVHYGFVGTRCGFDERELQEGAASNLPGAGGNDEGDVISVKIGIDLWKGPGLGLDEKALRMAIIARTGDYQSARAREIAGGAAPGKATNVVITDNDFK